MHVTVQLLTTEEMKYVAEREVKVLLQGGRKGKLGKKHISRTRSMLITPYHANMIYLNLAESIILFSLIFVAKQQEFYCNT